MSVAALLGRPRECVRSHMEGACPAVAVARVSDATGKPPLDNYTALILCGCMRRRLENAASKFPHSIPLYPRSSSEAVTHSSDNAMMFTTDRCLASLTTSSVVTGQSLVVSTHSVPLHGQPASRSQQQQLSRAASKKRSLSLRWRKRPATSPRSPSGLSRRLSETAVEDGTAADTVVRSSPSASLLFFWHALSPHEDQSTSSSMCPRVASHPAFPQLLFLSNELLCPILREHTRRR